MFDYPSIYNFIFTASIKNQETFLVAAKTYAAIPLATLVGTFPLWVRIRQTANRCEYIGTILVRLVAGTVRTEIVDEFDEKKPIYAGFVRGCDLAKSLASHAEADEIDAANVEAFALRRKN